MKLSGEVIAVKKRWKMGGGALATSVLICLVVALPAVQGREVVDLNLTERITLTLANSISEEYQYGPDDAADLMDRPDFYLDEEEGIYTYSFRIKGARHPRYGTFDGSGYYRIASPTQYRKPKTEEGWRLLGEDEETRALVWFREVRKSETQKYNEVQASLKSGNLTLTVSLRRPMEESPAEAEKVILERFGQLIDQARRHGILCRVVIEMVSEEEIRPLAEGALVNILGQEAEETRVPFRIYSLDYQDNRLTNIDCYIIKLRGALGKFARIEGAVFNEEKHQYEVHDQAEAEVELVFPALAEKAFARALEENSQMRSGFGIIIDVDVSFKPERRA